MMKANSSFAACPKRSLSSRSPILTIAGRFGRLENLLVPTGQRKRLEIRLESTILVSGRVLDPDGKPVANAAISAIANSDEGSGLADTSTDEAGRYALRLPSGVVKLYFNSLPSGFIYPNEQIIANLDLKQGQDDVQDLDFKLERDQ